MFLHTVFDLFNKSANQRATETGLAQLIYNQRQKMRTVTYKFTIVPKQSYNYKTIKAKNF